MKLLLFAVITFLSTYSEARTIGLREFGKTWPIQDNVMYYINQDNQDNIGNEKFIFAACIIDNHAKGMDCNLTIEKTIMDNATFSNQSCKMKRIADVNKNIDKLFAINSIKLFNNDHIILTGFDQDKDWRNIFRPMKVTIVNLKTCSSIELTFDLVHRPDTYVSQVFPYKDTFDVILSDLATCKGAPACKITYDKTGKIISGPMSFPVTGYTELYPITSESDVKGFFGLGMMLYGSFNYTLKHISRDNKETDLLFIHSTVDKLSQISNSYEKLGFCCPVSKKEQEIHCVQYDPDIQKMTINITMKLDLLAGEEIKKIRVYNLKNSGLLIATIVKYNNNNIVSNLVTEKLIITKINLDGYQKDVIEIDGVNCKCISPLLVILETDAEFCFRIACTLISDSLPSYLSVDVKCISKVTVYES